MLAPDPNDAIARLTDAYADIVGIDNFALSCQSIQIVPIPDEPDWLPPVAGEFKRLDAAADVWQLDRAQVWAPVILAFQNYSAVFSAFAGLAKPQANDAHMWIELLTQTLLPQVAKSLATTQAAERELQGMMQAFNSVLPQMDASIEAGWNALASEEQQMLALTEELGELVSAVQALGSKITSDAIGSDTGIAQSAVSMLYSAGAAGAAATVPVLGLVVAVLSIGKSFYTLIEDDQQLISQMNKINALKLQLSGEALGLALTKSTLQTLYSIQAQYLGLRDALPLLVDLWANQQSKLQDAVAALRAGASPDAYLDLATLPTALAAWQTIDTFVAHFSKTDFTVGAPVTIDIGKAQIRPTFPSLARA